MDVPLKMPSAKSSNGKNARNILKGMAWLRVTQSGKILPHARARFLNMDSIIFGRIIREGGRIAALLSRRVTTPLWQRETRGKLHAESQSSPKLLRAAAKKLSVSIRNISGLQSQITIANRWWQITPRCNIYGTSRAIDIS